MSKELLKMVFEAMSYGNAQDRESARLAVGEALAEQPAPVQEPVYYGDVTGAKEVRTIQAQRTWVGLTKQEFNECVDGLEDLEDCWTYIEAKLKEKNT